MAEPDLFVSTQLTPKNAFTFQIEGPAVDRDGNLYVCNLTVDEKPDIGGAIGMIRPGETKPTSFATLPVTTKGTKKIKSKGSGIRFDRDGRMYVADFNNHTIFVFEPGQSIPRPYFQADFHQPNDLAIARDGTLYASDPNPSDNTGRVWRISRGSDGKAHGAIMTARAMGRTNGLDLSPDEQTLYVGESNTRKVFAYHIDGTKLVGESALIDFGPQPPNSSSAPKFDLDGLRTDIDGLIYVTQNGAGLISVFTPQGQKARDPIKTVGKNPSNLTFGGPDGKTVFVTQADQGFVETFRVGRPGREPCMQFGGNFCG